MENKYPSTKKALEIIFNQSVNDSIVEIVILAASMDETRKNIEYIERHQKEKERQLNEKLTVKK